MKIIPYLYFPGTAEDALKFYRSVFSGEVVTLSRFREGPPDMPVPDGMDDKVMHARLEFEGCVIYFSDGHGEIGPSAHSLTVEFDDRISQNKAFELLADGGRVQFEL